LGSYTCCQWSTMELELGAAPRRGGLGWGTDWPSLRAAPRRAPVAKRRRGGRLVDPSAPVLFPRLATVFWYLEDVEEGGETFFPRALNSEGHEYKPWNGDHEDCYRGLAVKAVRGNAVLFYSMVPDGRLDERCGPCCPIALLLPTPRPTCTQHTARAATGPVSPAQSSSSPSCYAANAAAAQYLRDVYFSPFPHADPHPHPHLCSGRCTAGASRAGRASRSGALTSGSGTTPSAPPSSRPSRSARELRPRPRRRWAAPTTARIVLHGRSRGSVLRIWHTCTSRAGPAAMRAESRMGCAPRRHWAARRRRPAWSSKRLKKHKQYEYAFFSPHLPFSDFVAFSFERGEDMIYV
jgi:hypothetical protein